jgi:DUF1680 family protein
MKLDEFINVRKQIRLALPDDDTYLYRLGVAIYGFASINSFMTEIICHIDESQNRISLLSDKTSGRILEKFRDALNKIKNDGKYTEIYDVMTRTADLFERLNEQRNDFVHSYPITNNEKEQILHRRKDSDEKYFEVTNEFLDRFISQLHDVSSGLYEIRKAVRPDL